MQYGSDTERAAPAPRGHDPRVGRAAWGAAFYCTVTGVGVGAFVGEPLAGTVVGAVLSVPAAAWLAPAWVREQRDYWHR